MVLLIYEEVYYSLLQDKRRRIYGRIIKEINEQAITMY